MRVLIGILIAILVCIGGWRIWKHWQKVSAQEEGAPRLETVELKPYEIPGLASPLEYRLTEATEKGPKTLKQFIDTWRGTSLKDPRLAWAELDYVTLIASSDPLEAKKIFHDVKNRIPTNSVIYPRIRSLAKSYE
jgi:hypothetical protein